MLRIVGGIFIILHGLVHLLYIGQSRRLFELTPGIVWPDGSWVLSRVLGDEAVRLLASVVLLLAAISFVLSGGSLILKQSWSQIIIVSAAALSILIFMLLWNGQMRRLDAQGVVAVGINVLLVAIVLIWPPSRGG